ncbi:hypothetical protein ABB37_01051 [Leptomonas pyrrhocoris]|uniref:Actin-like protein n=1 Tax=Leptomonas pyrrhocoris TaxID=157538 RepID=A0A0N0VGW1_LEPPY|nr:hypothetical protein ABB37_01051 [Leptomonas pyrrhocoris]XP_015662942.1 hypothetical protein ABB37_01051 [Leptomonas pyrrhocoris]XP_015662943.1 hypothetical protein ABB37_01051 [Leptomonas pyrrhocoris]KPA84502.1 hypothetical protein ABB37_01051 [Leptomonas pyrrhocoris]KPA84503.1 hypothetical protein ABB37_01051 [Leptomonas pyrrhocoris]KPA84504.1 hypothetical protein ABB37_01051 [Leptomonas pyrrhocoris]|eukprot:XP_015662941.1 hypothetical protein ABB37_01051 [Leptomonas pyrrhocoris]
MYAVSISLGASSSYVAVTPVNSTTGTPSPNDVPPIKVIANSSGHRNTPVVASLMEQEVLFADNALHQYARQPQKVVPYLFSFAAAAASIADALHTTGAAEDAAAAESEMELTSDLLQVVEAAVRQKYKGHCHMTISTAGARRLGFEYTAELNGEPVESFISAEDLFIQFLNYVKEHSIDGACGLATSGGGSPSDSAPNSTKIFLSLVVPRYAFPEAADSTHNGHRSSTVEWLKEAVQASHLGAVVTNTSVVFSDEAAVLAYDGAAVERRIPRFLGTATHNMLVVDWGAHSLGLSLLCSRGGVLVCPPKQHNVPYRCFTKGSGAGSDGYFGVGGYSGGDALDLALAERVAAQYITQQRRQFASTVRNFNALMRLNQSLPSMGSAEHPATQLIQEAIPARAMRRLALLMAEKKVSLNTNPQASSVSVEVEAFYEGMDLMDNQTLSKNKLDNAIRSEWGLVDMFVRAVRAFAEKYQETWTEGFVDAVLLAGGMCQMSSLTKLLTVSITSADQRSLFSPNVRVLDSSVMGNGVCADELFCVGGCHLSYRVAEAFVALRLAKGRQVRKGAGKLRASIVAQAAEVASCVWDALTKDDDDDDDDDGSDAGSQKAQAGDAPHSGLFLTNNVYVYTGDATDLTTAATQTLARSSLQVLLSRSLPLPARVCIPWSPASSEAKVVLYLFTDAREAAAVSGGGEMVEVRPVYATGLTLTAAPAVDGSGSAVSFVIAVTAQAKWNEASEREVQLSVQLVRALPNESGSQGLPPVITPGNVCSTTEFILH